jgi:TusA-related sulfurtransferase
MADTIRLNLKGVISPLDLLKCKALLNTMETGDTLEVILRDQEVAEHLATIIRRSGDELCHLKKGQKETCLFIRRGTGKKTEEERTWSWTDDNFSR